MEEDGSVGSGDVILDAFQFITDLMLISKYVFYDVLCRTHPFFSYFIGVLTEYLSISLGYCAIRVRKRITPILYCLK